ncbi:inner membrane-spanning protein YciB [Hydrocarboniphaga sp.]|uniref:inner membrane-spanning protein YciB n=1 Tax=Hydrocarboniphaga sp. TaxID=2033016 RepID=UPI003D0F505E
MKILLEAGPLLAFLIVYALAGIYAATAVMVALSALALFAGRWIEGHYSGLSMFTLVVSSVLGGLTITLRDPTFIQYKPTIVFAAFALALGASHFVGERVALQTLFGKVLPMPDPLWRRVNALWAIYFGIHAVLNLYVAYHYSLQTWVYFKVFGFGAATVLFGLLHVPFLWPQLRAALRRPAA